MKITPENIYQEIIKKLSISDIHPLHKAMIEECCETAIKSNPEILDLDILTNAVQIAFLTCNSTLKATLQSAIELQNADEITLNYRKQKFIISKNSTLIN